MIAAREAFKIGSEHVAPGKRETIDLPVSVLSDHTPVTMSVHVIHGRKPGPTMFVSAAIHGDEIIGAEIIRRLLRASNLRYLRGTLIAIPIVNAFGFMNHSRYLPDRRDLNRSFPGSASGSLAARLANLLMQEVVVRCDIGIDLHSAAIHRENLPQIRVTEARPQVMKLAKAFGAPLILTSRTRPGSLRQAAEEAGVDFLLYEAGEGLRFDEHAARSGVSGILRVMRHCGMISGKGIAMPKAAPIRSASSRWQRAPVGGLLRALKTTGDEVARGDILGLISDPFGEVETEVVTEQSGLVIGRTNLPIVNEGDGLFHIARIKSSVDSQATIDSLANQLDTDPIFDEEEII